MVGVEGGGGLQLHIPQSLLRAMQRRNESINRELIRNIRPWHLFYTLPRILFKLLKLGKDKLMSLIF
jgi:hypothetical protein